MDNHDGNTRKQDEYRDHVDAEYDEIHGEKNYRELYYGFSEKGKIMMRELIHFLVLSSNACISLFISEVYHLVLTVIFFLPNQ